MSVASVRYFKRRPDPTVLVGWRYTGQPFPDWPVFVQQCCTQQRSPKGLTELRHNRNSGAQIVNIGEWLLRDPDGFVNQYTDDEVRRLFIEGDWP